MSPSDMTRQSTNLSRDRVPFRRDYDRPMALFFGCEGRWRMSRPPWKFGGGPGADQAAASSLLGVTVAIVASSAARSAGRCR